MRGSPDPIGEGGKHGPQYYLLAGPDAGDRDAVRRPRPCGAGLFRRSIDILIDREATGVVVGGCTVEFWALDMTERRQLFEHGVAAVAGRATVIAGQVDR
jgi:hypothetical protein